MLKTIICVENYVETACWKFQHVLNTVMHAESHVKTSRHVENVYVRHVENHIENHVEVRKKDHHIFTARVETERQISFFSFGFARVTEVRHIYIYIRSFVSSARISLIQINASQWQIQDFSQVEPTRQGAQNLFMWICYRLPWMTISHLTQRKSAFSQTYWH